MQYLDTFEKEEEKTMRAEAIEMKSAVSFRRTSSVYDNDCFVQFRASIAKHDFN